MTFFAFQSFCDSFRSISNMFLYDNYQLETSKEKEKGKIRQKDANHRCRVCIGKLHDFDYNLE